MDPADSGEGQEKPLEECDELSPSSRGRQRKKNSKYSDYETFDMPNFQSVQQKTPQKTSGRRRGPALRQTPGRSGKAEKSTQQTADGEIEAIDGTAQESDGKTAKTTPKNVGRAKKTPTKGTPAKKTPARKTPITDGTEKDRVINNVQQENEKPKRKYVRKKPKLEEESGTEAACKEAQGEPDPEEETQPGGRRRRSAAKAALKYLHILAKEVLSHPNDESGSQPGANSDITHTEPEPDQERKSLRGSKGRRCRKRKRADDDSDPAEDKDFVPGLEEEDVEGIDDDDDEEEAEDSDSDLDLRGGMNPNAPNGLSDATMNTVLDATETTKKFREEHFSSWVFPEWVPSTDDWHPVLQSDLEKYLPQELQSATFRVSREGLAKEKTPLQRLGRFTALPAHPARWDMVLYAGGPVWAMEWCPTPDGAPASQYIALACHRGMDDQHHVNKTYSGAGLVQLWDVGKLDYSRRPESQPALAYGLAQDKGFIWQLKWCPAGGWEPPSCGRKAPFLPRLGLLAVATSTCVVTIYSLPHPDALNSNNTQANSGKASQQFPIYRAKAVVTLKLGASKAPHHEKSGQVLTMDWLPEKPHNIMAIGFYDGVVGLWDLSTKSTLLQVREPDKSLTLLPYQCFLAHHHAVRALAFCPASRHLLVTAGEDRYVKIWDLRRLYDPITVFKRHLTNEIYWPLNATGILLAQDTAYSAASSHGVHFFDHHLQTYFAVPRTGTVWSISYTDWLNSVVTSDSLGEVILAFLPQICHSPQYFKRAIDRRFPVYLTSMEPHDTNKEENQEMTREEEERDAVEEQEGGETEALGVGSEGEKENNDEDIRDGGPGRREKSPPLQFQTYEEAVKKYYLHHADNYMGSFANSEKRAVWKRMKDTELKAKINMDDLPLASLHKVRFNPNMCCHTWLVSGGQAGLVRFHCINTITPRTKNMINKSKAKFNALYSPQDQKEENQTVTDDL